MSDRAGKEPADPFSIWQPRSFEGDPTIAREVSARRRTIHSVAELERLREEAWQEGFAEGRAAGREQGHSELREELLLQLATLRSLLDALQAPLSLVSEQVEKELVALAIAMAEKIVDDEVRARPERIVKLLPELLAQLPSAAREVKIWLHPEDARLIRSHLPDAELQAGWRLLEQEAIARGGCRIESSQAAIDARLQSRIRAVCEAALGAAWPEEANAGDAS